MSEQDVLAFAAAVERDAEHPLAEAIVRRAESAGAARLAVTAFENVPGYGAVATVDGHRVAVCNARVMARGDVRLDGLERNRNEMASEGRTVVAGLVCWRPC